MHTNQQIPTYLHHNGYFTRSITFLKRVINMLAITCLFIPDIIFAQDSTILQLKDTTSSNKDTIVLNNTTQYPAEIFLNRLDTIHSRLNRINNFSSRGFDTREIDRALPGITDNLNIINENLSLYSSVLDTKNLEMFLILLEDTKDQLNEWRTSLSNYNKELIRTNAEISSFSKDSVMKKFIQDSTYSNLYVTQLNLLKQKWKQANAVTTNNLAKTNQLQANVSNDYFEVIDLQGKARSQLRTLGKKSFSKEYEYLWELDSTKATDRQVYQLARKSYQGQKKIFQYYFQQDWDTRFWMLVIGIVFFWWVSRNFKRLEKAGVTLSSGNLNFQYLKKFPLLPTFIILFNLIPFFDLHPPSAYVQMIEFFLLIALTILFARNWKRKLFYYWIFIAVLFILFSLTSAVLIPGKGFRIWLLLLNTIAVVFGIFFIARFRKEMSFPWIVKPVSWVFLILNFLAVICNLYGRLSLAKLLCTAAIFGLTQIIGLSVFIQIIKEALQLQIEAGRKTGGIISRISYDTISKELNWFLNAVAVFIWLIIFTINLNTYDFLYMMIHRFLSKPRLIGSTSYEIGNLLLFVLIIYVSNLLQKYVGKLFGDENNNALPIEGVKKGSRLVMTRLILIVIGALLAIAASGLPIDKITIVLGALSVGIGLGLQSIVNNFVSGIVLIFERPFEIGDYVELDNKKGIIRDIGIRSSKLVTQDGAEIIMPNGDLLSGRVVNWTSRNNHIRIEISLNIEAGPKLEDVKKIVVDELIKSEEVLESIPPEVLLKTISGTTLGLTALVWIKNVNRDSIVRSELLNAIYNTLLQNNIKVI